MNTPRELGYYFPAEWEKHKATWLSYPHNENSWPDKIHTIFPYYHQFVKEVAKGELVHINVLNDEMANHVIAELNKIGVNMANIHCHPFPTNDAWCRDHGPAFLVNPNAAQKKIIVNWEHNAWGGKYPYELDTMIPSLIAEYLDLTEFETGIVMEGGSVDFNGKGTLITTTSCLLNQNRNPHLNQGEIEECLIEYYGVENVIWLGDGIEGDDTDGHVDDITRFVNEDTVITVVESDENSANYLPLKENLKTLSKARLQNGKQMNIAELPMPDPVIWEDQMLPASYANFYIANQAVIVPLYNCKQDQTAMDILSSCFKDREVVGIDSTEIIWGLGSFHCLSQQEPDVE